MTNQTSQNEPESNALKETPDINNRKRIARNSLFLALRQLLVMVIALFTSRVILDALGVVDFGVYNVVAGATASFVFFGITLATSTQRFLNVEMGRGNPEGVKRYFTISLWLYIIIAAVVLVAGIATGPWLVYDILEIPDTSRHAALIVFDAMIVSLAITFVFSVYESVLIARENMKIYAYLSIIDALVKLATAYIVTVVPDKLITYGLLMVLAMFIPKLILAIYCLRHYPESHPLKIWEPELLKELLKFAGWNIYSGLVYVFNDQGVNIALNLYFGPVVNAARGVTQQVYTAVVNFALNFFTAVRPQIYVAYAARAYEQVLDLISFSSRTSTYIVWALGLPILVRTPEILSLWLVDVPGYAVVFVRWGILYGLINAIFNPVQAAMQATGNLKQFSLVSINVFLGSFPAALIMLAIGAPAWTVYTCLCAGRFLSILITIPMLRPYIGITFGWYMRRCLMPGSAVMLLSTLISIGFDRLFGLTFGGLVLFALATVVTTLTTMVFIGLTGDERAKVLAKIHIR